MTLAQCWSGHRRLFWWIANRQARRWGGYPEDYLAELVLVADRCLLHYDASKGVKLSTYLAHALPKGVFRHQVLYDSDRRRGYWSLRGKLRDRPVRVFNLPLAVVAEDDALAVRPEPAWWTAEVLDRFPNPPAFWRALIGEGQRRLTGRQVALLVRRFRHGVSFRRLAREQGVSFQMISQVGLRALKKAQANLLACGGLDHLVGGRLRFDFERPESDRSKRRNGVEDAQSA